MKHRILKRVATAAAFLALPVAQAQLSTYAQDFEALDQMSETALGDDGWLVFATVLNPAGDTFLYNYGSFVAPNGSGGFSNVASDEGGPDQGLQQLVTFSDYNNADHGVSNQIISVVFQEQTISASDVDVWQFSFDAKKGDIAGNATARAIIRVLDPANGFSLSREIILDTTNLPETWQRYELDVSISGDLVGQLLQFGFETTATDFTPSGVFYDNVQFDLDIIDDDGDGIDDGVDNCLLVANPDQRDSNGDGFGNACDADLNNDNIVNVVDLGILRSVFFSDDADADFNGDEVVNIVDLGIMRVAFFGPPGPAAGSVVTLIDDFEDGDVTNWSFFGNNVDSGGGGEVRGDVSTPEGSVYFHTGWGGAGTASGFYGVAVRNFDNAEQVAVPAAAPHLNLWIRHLDLPVETVDSYVLEITLREDTNGDGWSNGLEDSIVAEVPVTQAMFDDQWRFVSIPLSNFSDALTGGNGSFDGLVDEIVLGIAQIQGAAGSVVEPEFDFIHFTAGAPLSMD